MKSNNIIFLIDLDLKIEWFKYTTSGKLEGMKAFYKIMKNKEKEKDIKKWRDSFGSTVLMNATFNGRVEIVEWLLDELKVDVNEQRMNGWSALHFAARLNEISCAHVLLKHHAAILNDHSGLDPLDWAKIRRYEEMENLIETHFNQT